MKRRRWPTLLEVEAVVIAAIMLFGVVRSLIR